MAWLSFIKHSAIWCKGQLWLLLVTLVLLFGIATPVSADSLDNWHWRNPLPQGNHLRGVTYGINNFVAVGWSGTILSSPDGIIWTNRSLETQYELEGVTYSINTFVAVGKNGIILTSSDGITWTSQSSGTTNNLFGVICGGDTFVVVGENGTILSSPDGINWTSRSSETSNNLRGVTYGNKVFVVVGWESLLTSPDGEIWTSRTLNTGKMLFGLEGVTYGNGTFITVGWNGMILSSIDGLTWIDRSLETSNLAGVTYGNNTFVAVGNIGSFKTQPIFTSSDGITWTSWSSDCTEYLNVVIYGKSTFVTVGSNGTILSSPDGISWTSQSFGTTESLNDVTYGNYIFVAVGYNGTIVTSVDGITWTRQLSGTTNGLIGLAYGDNIFVAVGSNGTILSSPDGINWSNQSFGMKNYFLEVTYGNHSFVAVDLDGDIWLSLDSKTWIAQRLPNSLYGVGVTYGNNTFVVVGRQGSIFTSPDGVTWTNRSLGISMGLDSVTYGNNSFVAVGGDYVSGTIVTSVDGITWTSTTNHEPLKEVTYGNHGFVTVGDIGTVLTSANGITWTSQTSGTTNSLYGVTYGTNSFVTVGLGGTILQTDMVTPPLTVTTVSLAPASIGSLYNATMTVGGGTFPYTWSAIGLPVGLSIDSTTGVISGTPTIEGTYTVKITVIDSNSHTTSIGLSLTVNNTLINPISNFRLTGKTYDFAVFNFTAPTVATAVKVQQSTDDGVSWTDSTTTSVLSDISTEAIVTNLIPSTAYKFKLVITGGSYAGESNIVNLTTNNFGFEPTGIYENTVDFSFTSYPTGATEVTLQQSTDNGTTWSDSTTSEKLTEYSKTFSVTELTRNTFYEFRLVIIGGSYAGSYYLGVNTGTGNATLTVGNSSTTGFTLTLTPALNGLTVEDLVLTDVTDEQNNTVNISSVTNLDNGATYIINATLTIGKTYSVMVIKQGNYYGAFSNEIKVTPTNGGTGDYTYTVTAGKAQITKYTGAGGIVTIPSTLGGFPVTSIGRWAFSYCTGIRMISLPQGVTSIGDYAFYLCYNLTTISLPQGVTSIGSSAFLYCTSLTTISIPQGVTSISDYAFSDCYSLTTISLPQGVTSIGERAFHDCYSLTTINIPQEVTIIGNDAFNGCTGLTTISIPQGVSSIGYSAFKGCTDLNTIEYNSATTTIYDRSDTIPVATKIIGYSPSTAKTYATKYNRMFEEIIVPVTGVSLNKSSLAINVGANDTLTATITPTNATNINITWSVNSGSGVVSILDGLITALTAGTATVRATSAADSTKYAECTVTVNQATVAVSSVRMKSSTTLTVGLTEQLTTAITPENATDRSVTWSVYSQSGSNIATISDIGLVTAVNPGTAVIRATSNADPTKYAECSVTVTAGVSSNFSATPIVQIGINSNDGDSAGIFVGLKDIRDSQGNLVPDAKLASYQIEVNYNQDQVTVFSVYNEVYLGHFVVTNTNTGKVSVADSVYHGTSNFEKLFFVPMAVTGSSYNLTNVIIKFTNLLEQNSKSIGIPEVALTFQRGKIVNEVPQESLSIADAVAGLQYLAKLIDAGTDTGKVNVINMASILPPDSGATSIKPSVKDIVALLQKLVGLRDDTFRITNVNGNATLSVTSVSAINADQVKVVYNEAVDLTSATSIGNYYTVNDAGIATPLTVSSVATLKADNKTVIITLDTPLINGGAYAFKVSGVIAVNLTVAPDYTTTFIANDTTAQFLMS